MVIDVSKFRATFLEESFEGLESMERGLLALEEGQPDLELVNTIFRAAHSIKGGAGTYGFQDVGRLTHVMETLLDEMRAGTRRVERAAIDALLVAVDCLGALFKNADDPSSKAAMEGSMEALEALLEGDVATDAPVASADETKRAPIGGRSYEVTFEPTPGLFMTGNDPARLLRVLAELGECAVHPVLDRLPEWQDFDAESCYLGFRIDLAGAMTPADIDEVFEWVVDDANIRIVEHAATAVADGSDLVGATPPDASDPALPNAKRQRAGSETSSIRVEITKVDELINIVGELVITQSMLGQVGQEFDMDKLDRLRAGLLQLERNTRELQESVMQIRMVPMGFAFGRIPRVVRDVADRLGKQVELEVAGEQTELDKTVLERIHDPLVHIVRNSVDHGIETPNDRLAAGKPAFGTVSLNAFHRGGSIVIEVRDDGRGLDVEKIRAKAREKGLIPEGQHLTDDKLQELIFAPGFSTAAEITDVSGRGVGMDVVKRNIDSLGGTITVESTVGKGTTISIRLPLTLAILDGQTVSVGREKYILPLNSIIETIQLRDDAVHRIVEGAEVFLLRKDYVRLLRLAELFGIPDAVSVVSRGLIVVVEGGGEKIGLLVDELLAQQQIVIKSLETNYQKVDGISGATILGDGRVALIADVAGLVRLASGQPPSETRPKHPSPSSVPNGSMS